MSRLNDTEFRRIWNYHGKQIWISNIACSIFTIYNEILLLIINKFIKGIYTVKLDLDIFKYCFFCQSWYLLGNDGLYLSFLHCLRSHSCGLSRRLPSNRCYEKLRIDPIILIRLRSLQKCSGRKRIANRCGGDKPPSRGIPFARRARFAWRLLSRIIR